MTLGGLKESKVCSDEFQRAQKQWAKYLKKVNDAKKTYFNICKEEKTAEVQVRVWLVVHSSLIQSGVKPMTLKLAFAASLRDAQHQRDSGENKPRSLLVKQSGKGLKGIPLF